VTDHRSGAGQHSGERRDRQREDERRDEPLRRVDQDDRNAEPLAVRAPDVRRADVAAAVLPDVLVLEEPDEPVPRRDRAREVTGDDGEGELYLAGIP
jgi:hypothetical protein